MYDLNNVSNLMQRQAAWKSELFNFMILFICLKILVFFFFLLGLSAFYRYIYSNHSVVIFRCSCSNFNAIDGSAPLCTCSLPSAQIDFPKQL